MSKLKYFQNMHTILLMEMEGLNLDEQLAVKAKDFAAQDMRLALLIVESYEAHLVSHCNGPASNLQNDSKCQVLVNLLED